MSRRTLKLGAVLIGVGGPARFVRTEYESTTLRGNLGLPIPENRHTAARTELANRPVANRPEADEPAFVS